MHEFEQSPFACLGIGIGERDHFIAKVLPAGMTDERDKLHPKTFLEVPADVLDHLRLGSCREAGDRNGQRQLFVLLQLFQERRYV
ncbi:MAG TPA: hypothetical protein PLL18_17765, partial [Flavobacteriales bacterium]|nr:hypothetical protein [Flavobacteriales bacterium]